MDVNASFRQDYYPQSQKRRKQSHYLEERNVKDRLGIRQIVLFEIIIESSSGGSEIFDARSSGDACATHDNNVLG